MLPTAGCGTKTGPVIGVSTATVFPSLPEGDGPRRPPQVGTPGSLDYGLVGNVPEVVEVAAACAFRANEAAPSGIRPPTTLPMV